MTKDEIMNNLMILSLNNIGFLVKGILSEHYKTFSCEILSTFLQNIYFYYSYSSKTFLEGHERAFRGHESALRGRDSAFRDHENVC